MKVLKCVSYLNNKDSIGIATDTNHVSILYDLETHYQIIYPQAKNCKIWNMHSKVFRQLRLLLKELQRKDSYGVTSYIQQYCLGKYINDFNLINLTDSRPRFCNLLLSLLFVIIDSAYVLYFRGLRWNKWFIKIYSFLVKWKVNLLTWDSRI